MLQIKFWIRPSLEISEPHAFIFMTPFKVVTGNVASNFQMLL